MAELGHQSSDFNLRDLLREASDQSSCVKPTQTLEILVHQRWKFIGGGGGGGGGSRLAPSLSFIVI